VRAALASARGDQSGNCDLSSEASKLTSDRREQTNQFPDPAHSHSRRSDGVGVGDACEMARCVPGRMRGPVSKQRDSEAAGLHLTPYCVTFDSSTGSRGSLCVGNKCPKGHTQYVLGTRPGEQVGGPGAQLASTVAGDGPPCQPRQRRRLDTWAGSDRFPAQSR